MTFVLSLFPVLTIWFAGTFLAFARQDGPAQVCPLFPSEHERIGVNVVRRYGKSIEDYDVGRMNAGWYVDYTAQLAPPEPAGMTYVQMISGSGFDPARGLGNAEAIEDLVDANPGAMWTAGNEPDRREYQDSLTPAVYAVFYHDLYMLIKARDPTARVAAGGIVQPTPLRLRYLDMALEAYQEQYGTDMPVDVWTIHGFILPEKRDGWGADIPPGLEAYAAEGKEYKLEDHARMDIFQARIVEFRKWMAARGYRNRPLVVSEYGILMPEILGFDGVLVRDFMLDSFDFFRRATDLETGYPADGNRLVQAWSWYSLNERRYDINSGGGFNGNLFDHDSGKFMMLGEAFAAYTAPLVEVYADPAIATIGVLPSSVVSSTVALTLTVEVNLLNRGTLAAEDVTLEIWRGKPDSGELVGIANGQVVALPCSSMTTASVVWRDVTLSPGITQITARIKSRGDRELSNNEKAAWIYALQLDDGMKPTDPRYGKIAGVVFEDLNGNGVREKVEPGVEDDVLIIVRRLGTAFEDAVWTGPGGTYEFSKLLVGTYTVEGTLPAGFASVEPESQSVNVSDGATATANFRLSRETLWMPQIDKR